MFLPPSDTVLWHFDTAAAAPYTYVMAFFTNGTGCLGMLWKSDVDLTVHYNR